jgi:hypothetical protein
MNSGTEFGTGTFVYVFRCSGAAIPEAAKRGDKHGEGGGERGRGARRVGATGPAGGGAGRAVGLAGQPPGHRRHGQQDIFGPAAPLGAGVPQGPYIYFVWLNRIYFHESF